MLIGDLLLDLLVECVAQAAGERDRDARILLLEIFDPALERLRRPGAIERHAALGLGPLIERVSALGADGIRKTDQKDNAEQNYARRMCNHGLLPVPRTIHFPASFTAPRPATMR